MNRSISTKLLSEVMNRVKGQRCLICNQPITPSEGDYIEFLTGYGIGNTSHYHCYLPVDRTELVTRPLEHIIKGITPHQHVLINHYFRQVWIHYWKTWALPLTVDHMRQVIAIVGNDQWLEVGAGSGFQGFIWQKAGVTFCGITDLAPLDYADLAHDPPIYGANKPVPTAQEASSDSIDSVEIPQKQLAPFKPYLEVEALSATDAVSKYPQAKVLFVCWAKEIIYDSVRAFDGDYIVEIGDLPNGNTDFDLAELLTDDFSRTSSEEIGYTEAIRKRWTLHKTITIPKWYYCRDVLRIFKRTRLVN